MVYDNAIVKCYKRKKSKQYLITLKGNHGFKRDEEVIILSKEEYREIEDLIELRKNKISDMERRLNELEAMKLDKRIETYEKLEDDYNRLRNKHDHLQERLRTALEEINQQQKVISDLSNRGFTDYLFGRLPESYKQLSEPEK